MSKAGKRRRILGPFNRVEGDLEVRIEVADGRIEKAWVNSPLFRGFEQILQGKNPDDALVYTPRICGICSVSQSVAAATALARAQGLEPSPNGALATNLILAAENLADHLSHFYLFFMPDFARPHYAGRTWYAETAARFRAQSGSASRKALPARAAFLHITGLLAGKWPHSLAIQPGGTTRSIGPGERIRLLATIRAFRLFLEETLFGAPLEAVAALENEAELMQWMEHRPEADFPRFLHIANDLKLAGLGRATDRFMSYGAYPAPQGPLFKAGVWHRGLRAFDATAISEDISHSWLNMAAGPAHPYQGSTIPNTDERSGYSWCKAPRLDGAVLEVGALARQVVDGHPLICDLVQHDGGNVRNRVIARLLELALVVPAMERWADALRPGEPFCRVSAIPDEARGAGLVEAARGSLGHWVRIHKGRILNYQIIAPTTWNFSPRDAQERPGALELALEGTQLDREDGNSIVIQHIIRSFDPCMVCTVH